LVDAPTRPASVPIAALVLPPELLLARRHTQG
jgi:hypothetical protein